jgi:pSer/pThr/pTyr-binding forkhead associated (FHA) protein
MPRILVKKREEIISEYVARKTKVRVLIGSKKGNDIVIADKNVSEQHCVVSLEASGQYSVKDLNTIAGTQLMSRLISESPL